MNLYDIHKLTSLKSHGPAFHLGDAFRRALTVELLGCAYPNEIVWYYLLSRDFASHSQVTPEDGAQIAKAFLLHVVRAMLFANVGQTVPFQ